MTQHAIKIPVAGATPPTGCTIYHVRTVWLDDADQEVGGAVYFEVDDDITSLPLAADFDMAVAITKAETILNQPGPDDVIKKEALSTVTGGRRLSAPTEF
jgi:hypothetical protein